MNPRFYPRHFTLDLDPRHFNLDILSSTVDTLPSTKTYARAIFT